MLWTILTVATREEGTWITGPVKPFSVQYTFFTGFTGEAEMTYCRLFVSPEARSTQTTSTTPGWVAKTCWAWGLK